MKPLAIIPARAGSKRLPGKNRELIGGKSLVEIACGHAAAAGLPAFVTADDTWFFLQGASTWWPGGCKRSDELALDDTPMMDVVRDAVRWARAPIMEVDEFDAVILLQPTSPLRTADDIRRAIDMLESADAVISVVETSAPEIFTIGHAGRMRQASLHRDGLRLAVPNGAIFAITMAALDRGLDWWTADVVRAYEMPPERSVDIDTIVDLERARELWDQHQH